MANPIPEIMPELAKNAGAAVVGTGRSDFPNQINNILAFLNFPWSVRCSCKDINDKNEVAAAYAIANQSEEDKLNPDYIIPNPFDERVAPAVAKVKKQKQQEKQVWLEFNFWRTVNKNRSPCMKLDFVPYRDSCVLFEYYFCL